MSLNNVKTIEFYRNLYKKDPNFMIDNIELVIEDAYVVRARTVIDHNVNILTVSKNRASSIAIPFTVAFLEMRELLNRIVNT